MIDQFINFVIRPPRAEYNPDQYLWEKTFTLAGRKYKREDLELRNERGHTLQCSHYVPSHFPDGTSLPCVIYCHGNSGCRADANEAAVILLPSNITLFTLDFSGSGVSDGNYVSLGWHEKNDLKVVVSYLRSNTNISRIGLWGRSMGAVTRLFLQGHDLFITCGLEYLPLMPISPISVWKWKSLNYGMKGCASVHEKGLSAGGHSFAFLYHLEFQSQKPLYDEILVFLSLLYGAEDPSIAGMVLDSAFSNLFDLMMELVDVYKIRLPKFTVKVAVQYMRRVIQKKAKFDIMNLSCVQVAPRTYIPALFGHAKDDKFIQSHHSDLIFQSYVGDKNMIKFDGDHNSSRPQFYYDSVSIFFYNVLHPPRLPSAHSSNADKYYDLGDLKVNAKQEENLLYEIIAGIQSSGGDVASSSSLPPCISTAKSVDELLSEIAPVTCVPDTFVVEDAMTDCHDSSKLQDKPCGQNEESCSYTSSNRESWGRCSSLGSDEEPTSDCPVVVNSNQIAVKVLATPPRDMQRTACDLTLDEKNVKKTPTRTKKCKREKLEKLGALTQRLRHCILKKVNHRRHCSS